jgi:integrase
MCEALVWRALSDGNCSVTIGTPLPQAIHFHDLRHAHATNLLRAGVGIKTASSRLGHSGITITGDLYQHVASEMDQEAAERAAQVLRVAK